MSGGTDMQETGDFRQAGLTITRGCEVGCLAAGALVARADAFQNMMNAAFLHGFHAPPKASHRFAH